MHRLLGESETIGRRKDACLISTSPLHPFVVLSHPFSNCRAVLIVKNKIKQKMLLSAPQNSYLLICAGTAKPMCRTAGCTLHSAFPASGYFLPRTRRRSAGARDLFSLHGAQRDENKFEMEVSFRSTELRTVLI